MVKFRIITAVVVSIGLIGAGAARAEDSEYESFRKEISRLYTQIIARGKKEDLYALMNTFGQRAWGLKTEEEKNDNVCKLDSMKGLPVDNGYEVYSNDMKKDSGNCQPQENCLRFIKQGGEQNMVYVPFVMCNKPPEEEQQQKLPGIGERPIQENNEYYLKKLYYAFKRDELVERVTTLFKENPPNEPGKLYALMDIFKGCASRMIDTKLYELGRIAKIPESINYKLYTREEGKDLKVSQEKMGGEGGKWVNFIEVDKEGGDMGGKEYIPFVQVEKKIETDPENFWPNFKIECTDKLDIFSKNP